VGQKSAVRISRKVSSEPFRLRYFVEALEIRQLLNGDLFPDPSYVVGGTPTAIAAVDLNGDGKIDLVVAAGTGLSVLLNTGGGAFSPAVQLSTPYSALSIAVADLNGDGRPDLIAADKNESSTGDLSVFLNQGGGTFAPAVNYVVGPTNSNATVSVAAGDFNGDGHQDVVATTGVTFAILLGDGTGILGTPTTYSIPSSGQPINLAKVTDADLNGDSRPDLILNFDPNDTKMVDILLNDGNATFAAPVSYTGGFFNVVGTTVADVNNDGYPDLILTDGFSQGAVLLNQQNGTFGSPMVFADNTRPAKVVAADLNGDGNVDLIILGSITPITTIFYGNGTGAFGSATPANFAGSLNVIASADLDGDGHIDLAVAGSGISTSGIVSVLSNFGDGTFPSISSYGLGPGAAAYTVADMNGDGLPDLLAVAGTAANSVSVALNEGNGTFGTPTTYPAGNLPEGVAAADVNGDGKPDIIVADEVGDTVSVLLNLGNGAFASAVTYRSISPIAIMAIDINGDGKPDILAGLASGGVQVLLNQGNGTFVSNGNFGVNENTNMLAVADLNGDGKPDLIIPDLLSHNIDVLMNIGGGKFGSTTAYAAGNRPFGVAAADLNGDGHPDVVVTTESSTVLVLLNNGNGTLAPAVPYADGDQGMGIAIADVNQDGFPDLVVSDTSAATISVLLNTGAGTFANPLAYRGNLASSILAADVNGDGAPDLITSLGGPAEVLINQGSPAIPLAAASTNTLVINGAIAGGPVTLSQSNGSYRVSGAAQSISLPASGITKISFNGVTGTDTLDIASDISAPLTYMSCGGADTINVGTGDAVTLSGDPGSGGGSVTVNVAGSLKFAAPAAGAGINVLHISSLNVFAGASVAYLAPANHADRTLTIAGAITIAAGGTIDVGGNDLIIHNGTVSQIAKGILSSAATSNTTLGIELNDDGTTSHNPLTTTFDNQTVATTDVLVKYTYYGDADLNGSVTAADYIAIDNGINQNLTGWNNGDFNYDGKINGDDYTLIDNAYNTQSTVPLAIISKPLVKSATAPAQFIAPPTDNTGAQPLWNPNSPSPTLSDDLFQKETTII
jgi:FG-GAP-like repeat